MDNLSERLDNAKEFILASRLNECNDATILYLVSNGSGKNNTQSELIYNLIMQEVI